MIVKFEPPITLIELSFPLDQPLIILYGVILVLVGLAGLWLQYKIWKGKNEKEERERKEDERLRKIKILEIHKKCRSEIGKTIVQGVHNGQAAASVIKGAGVDEVINNTALELSKAGETSENIMNFKKEMAAQQADWKKKANKGLNFETAFQNGTI